MPVFLRLPAHENGIAGTLSNPQKRLSNVPRKRQSSVEEALIEMYLAGVSVRRVEDIAEAEAVLPKGKKTVQHTEEIRYVVSDPEIVSVTKNGKIKGKKKGNCTVYAVAQNGVYGKIRVKVK